MYSVRTSSCSEIAYPFKTNLSMDVTTKSSGQCNTKDSNCLL